MSDGIATQAGMYGGAFNVLSLSPSMWLDGSDVATFFDATSGGANVPPDGAIARWEDKSGNGNHATQATAIRRPLRKTSIINGRPVVQFNGVFTPGLGTFLDHPLNEPANFTAFVVVKTLGAGAQFLGMKTSGAVTLMYDTNTGWGTFNSGPAFLNSGGSVTSLSVISMQKSAGMTMRTNGVTGYSSGSYTPYSGDNNNRRTIGGYSNVTIEETLNGDIAEIIVCPSILTNAQIIATEAYLKNKWGTP